MPQYCFICDGCKEESELCMTMRDIVGVQPVCPKCCSVMRRDWTKEQIGKPIGAGDWPKVTRDLDEDGTPTVYNSYKELDRLAAERGCHVFTGDAERQYQFRHRKDRIRKGEE